MPQPTGIRNQASNATFPERAATPTVSLIVSVIAGNLGIDRFLIGDTGLGIGKLLTCGGLGIWAIIDWFLIMPATREKNLLKLQQVIY
jgi:TM2 domain-containing membrane protein YozV